jgi:hypothetical protein
MVNSSFLRGFLHISVCRGAKSALPAAAAAQRNGWRCGAGDSARGAWRGSSLAVDSHES